MACSPSSLLRCIFRRRVATTGSISAINSFRKYYNEPVSHNSAEAEVPTSGDSCKKSVEQVFRDPRVQSLLKMLAGRDISRVFKERQLKKLTESKIKLMTDMELKEYTDRKLREIDHHLQIPPIMEPRGDCVEILDKDPLLEHFDTHAHVFTDITYAVKPRSRYIVVREVDGTLRTASWEERDRMQQIYFPIEGRELNFPKMFEDQYLKESLEKDLYVFILDRACVQFEPDDPHFIRVCQAVYSHVNQNRAFSVLESSRHMGGLLFFLVHNNRIDNYLIYLLQNDRLKDSGEFLRLYNIVQSDNDASIDDPAAAIKEYISTFSDSPQRTAKLELALQACLEKTRERAEELESNEVKRSSQVN